MHKPILPLVRIRFRNQPAIRRTLKWLNVAVVMVAIVAVFPMLGAWRLSRQGRETRTESALVAPVITLPAVGCEDAAVTVDRLSTDFTIVLLTPVYIEKFVGLRDLEALSTSGDSSLETRSAAKTSLDHARQFLKLSRQDPEAVDVRKLAQAHAELNHALADLSAQIRRHCA